MTAHVQHQPPLKVKRGLVPGLVFIGMVVAILSSLGAPLVPDLAQNYHVSLITAQWTLTIAFLASAIATPTMGRVGDGPGRQKMIIGGLAVVVVGCLLAALPLGFPELLVGRALQGVGLGLTPLTMATARDALGKDKATPAVAMLSLTTVVGVGLGYPLTGLIVQLAGLHAAFWFGALMSLVGLMVAWVWVPEPTSKDRVGRDVGGAVLLAGALAFLLLGLSEGPVWGWVRQPTVGCLVLALAMIVGWLLVERRAAHPLVNIALLRPRPVQTADVTAVLAGVGMYLLISLITRFMQTPRSAGYGLGSSVLVTGLVLVPFSVFSLLASRVASALLRRLPPGRVLTVACAPMLLALLLFTLGRGGGLTVLFIVMGLAGLGTGCIFSVMPQLIVNAVPPAETGSAISFNQVSRLVGYSAGSALSAIILEAATHGDAGLPTDSGYTVAGIVGAALWIITAAAAAVLPGRIPRITTKTGATSQAAQPNQLSHHPGRQ